MSKSYLKGSLLATTVIAGFAIASPAFAQTPPVGGTAATTPDTTDEGTTAATGPGVQPQEAVPPAQDEGGEIVVTGTLIRNPNLTSSSPVAVVGQEEIQLRQSNSAEQILRDTPGVVPGLGQNVNNGTNGSATIDLRGFGSKRNLVLLDSTRLVPASFTGTVDLNNIPLALIDRIDVLTGGASTTYGADAVTGVVNFITKKDFAGMDLQVSEQETERGDGNTLRADLALGANFDDGRGNAVVAIGYVESDPVYFGDRDLGQCVVSSISGFCGGDSPTATPTSFGFVTNAPLGFPNTNNLQIQPNGLLGLQFAQYNFNPFNVYQIPFRRYNAFAASHYDVSDKVSVYGRALFSKNIQSGIIAPSGVFGEQLTVPGNNPFLSPALRDQFCTLSGIALGAACNTNAAIPLGIVYRRSVEVGPRISEYTTNIFDFKAGAQWNITQNINLDVYGAYGESERREVRKNYVARSRLQQALNASTIGACDDPSGGCVPLNLFGQPGSITPEMAGFIGGVTSTIVNKATLAQVHGVLSGDVGFAMPWATQPVAFAVGAEHRDYGAERQPDSLAQQPGELGGAGGAIVPIVGGYTAEDIFAELIVPVISDRPFFQELTLEGGYRRSHYAIDAPGNPKFTANTYKIGATWQPIEAIKFRANWQQAVRAPNIGELFTPVATGLTNLGVDPCAGANPVGNANLTAVCLAQGAPGPSIGSIQQPAAGQANITAGGNPLLSPETARTLTVGVVITPRSLIPGFNATLDYYRIKVVDAIAIPTPGALINACFGDNLGTGVTAGSATDPACTSIRRNPVNGRLSGSPVDTPGLPGVLSNIATLFTDGFDATMNYRHTLGFADLILNFNGNWTRHAWQDTGVPFPNCPGVYSVNCGIALGQLGAKYSWNQRTTLSFKPVDVSLLWRHLSKFHYQKDLPPLCDNPVPVPAPAGCTGFIRGGGPFAGDEAHFNSIPAYDYFDLTTRFSITDNFELTLSAFNIFDKKAPIVGNNAASTTAGSGNTFPSTYDMLGRRYGAAVRLKF